MCFPEEVQIEEACCTYDSFLEWAIEYSACMNCGLTPCVERLPASVGMPEQVFGGRWIIAATVLGSSMEFIDGTVVNVALPSLQRSFAATGTQVQWVVEAYALFLSALLLTGGSLGDRFGLRKTFLAGVVLFACASVWCGFAGNLHQLLIARCLQGAGGALLLPNSLAFLSASFSGVERGRVIGTWSGFASMMTALGPVVGGWTVQHGSWRRAFLLNVPIAISTVWITLAKTRLSTTTTAIKTMDWRGALLGAAGLSLITFSLMQWEAGKTVTHVAGLVGVVFLMAFVCAENSAVTPLMPLDLFRNRSFTGSNLVTFFLYSALAGALFYLPLNLIQIQGYSPTQAGAAMLPLVVIMFLLSRWAGGLLAKYGPKLPLIVGPFIISIGYVLLARPGVGDSYWKTYFPAMVVLGFGMAVSVAPLTTVVMSSVNERRVGTAAGINNAFAQTAALFAIAICSPLFYRTFSHSLPIQMRKVGVSVPISGQIEEQKRRLGAIETQDALAKSAIDASFVSAFRLIALVAGGSAATAGIIAALTIRNDEVKPDKNSIDGHSHQRPARHTVR